MTLDFQRDIEKMTDRALIEFKNAKVKKRTDKDRLNAVGNIYFLFLKNELKYIGQRQASGIKQRLDQHLFGKSYSVDINGKQNGTISKWHKVSEEIEKGNEITFKTILITPDTLRTTIELELISRLKPEWNIQGK